MTWSRRIGFLAPFVATPFLWGTGCGMVDLGSNDRVGGQDGGTVKLVDAAPSGILLLEASPCDGGNCGAAYLPTSCQTGGDGVDNCGPSQDESCCDIVSIA